MTAPLTPPTPAALLKCPFMLCQARPEVTMHQPESRYPEVWHQIVLTHSLVNSKIPGSHNCPASLTKYPTPAITLTKFAQDLMHFVRMMSKDEASGMIREILDGYPVGTRADGPAGGRPTDPPDDDPSWQRGGRADEDVPDAPQEGIEGRRPMGTTGVYQSEGDGMATNAEVVAMVNSINTVQAEVLAVIESALEEFTTKVNGALFKLTDEAGGVYATINASSVSLRLQDAAALNNRAIADGEEAVILASRKIREEVIPKIGAAQEKNNEFIQAVMG